MVTFCQLESQGKGDATEWHLANPGQEYSMSEKENFVFLGHWDVCILEA